MSSRRLTARTAAHHNLETNQEAVQSFELTKTYLAITVATVCYLRELLPLQCFDDKDFAAFARGEYWSHDSFIVARSSQTALAIPSSQNAIRRGQFVKVIARDSANITGKLLGWTDSICQAIKLGGLKAAQMSIIAAKDKPEHVLESYTFSFTYKSSFGSNGSSRELQSIQLAKRSGQSVSLGSHLQDINALTRSLVTLCGSMPRLPETRFLTFHLFHDGDCPIRFDLLGFSASKDLNMMMPNTHDWVPSSIALTNFSTDKIRTSLLTTSLVRAPNSIVAAGAEDILPKSMRFDKAMARMTMTIGPELPELGPTQRSDATSSRQQQQSLPRQSQRSNFTMTQLDSPAVRMRDGLIAMARSSSIPQSLIPTQLPPSTMEWGNPVDLENSLVVPESVHPHSETGHHDAIDTQTILCDCEFNKSEGKLIQCSSCGTSQHMHCYALNPATTSIEDHLCYSCLHINETQTIEQKRSLNFAVKIRRVLWNIEHCWRGEAEGQCAKLLEYDINVFRKMISRLKEENMIVEAREARKKGFSQTGASRWRVVESEKMEKQRSHGLLSPMYGILQVIKKHAERKKALRLSKVYDNQIEHATRYTDICTTVAGSTVAETTDELMSSKYRTPKRNTMYAERPITANSSRPRGATTKRMRSASFEEEGNIQTKRLRAVNAISPMNVSARFW